MKWSLEGKWITGGFGLVVMLIGAVSVTSYQNATQLVESANQVSQTNKVLDVLTDLSATLADAESRRWGFILFGDRDELQRYHAAIQSLDGTVERLKQPFADTPLQQQRLHTLEFLLQQRVRFLQRSIELYQEDQTSIVATDPLIEQLKQNQDEIRQLITALETTEEELLQTQVEQVQSKLQQRMLIEPLGTLLTFGIFFGVYGLLYRQMVKRQEAESQQRTLSQQKELSELKLHFFSMVSHEFRTPLSLILGSAQLLNENLKHQIAPGRLKNLYRIQSSAKQMTQQLSDILTLARADAGKLEYKPEWVEMQTFCLNLVEDFQISSEAKRSFKFNQQGNCTHAYLDEKLLYSVLSNLLSNAIKFSPPESSIYFTLICEPNCVIFQIQDKGIGISTNDQAHIYDLFVRGENARSVTGTGLGLAVVKRCLALQGGQISVDSQLDRGTTFTVKIPQSKLRSK